VEAQRLGGGGRGSPNWWGQTRQAAARWSVAAASMTVREQAARWRRPRVTGQRGGEFYFFGRERTRGSEDAGASGGDTSVRTDARVKSLSLCIYG
jgi:hypothetical protein